MGDIICPKCGTYMMPAGPARDNMQEFTCPVCGLTIPVKLRKSDDQLIKDMLDDFKSLCEDEDF